MRDFKGMKRQRGRNRPGGGGGGGGKPGNANRAFDSQGPENLKVRGSAQHIFEKYQQLARDATGAGDRVLLENYLQHAEHYYRLIRTLQPQRTPAEIMGRETVGNGYDLDFEDEAIEAMQNASAEAGANAPEEPLSDDGRSDGSGREGQNRDAQNQGQREFREGRDSPRRDREGSGEFRRDREAGPREFRDGPREGPREKDGPREPRGDREFRDRGEFRRDRDRDRDRPREGGESRPEGRYGERPRSERIREEGREPAPGVEPDIPGLIEPVAASSGGEGDMLRDEEGGLSPAPAFLQAPAPAPAAEDAEPRTPRPRRRRTRATVEASDGEAPAPAPDGDEG